MGFYDFLETLPQYQSLENVAARMNRRHQYLISPFRDEIAGARVLDLAAHDGRWSYAFADAGASEVHGIEARADMIAQFADYPDAGIKARVTLHHGDLFEFIESAIATGTCYDVIGVFGILYHLMDHHRLFAALRKLSPKLVIVDSEFVLRPGAVIKLVRERTDKVLNVNPYFENQQVAVKGIPSFNAMEVIADTLDYDLAWSDWTSLPAGQRNGVQDYFRVRNMRRATCVLRPR